MPIKINITGTEKEQHLKLEKTGTFFEKNSKIFNKCVTQLKEDIKKVL